MATGIGCMASHPEETHVVGKMFRQTPLHMACIRYPPLHVIQLMISLAPEVPFKQNRDGETPLHVACSSASEDIQLVLIQACPESVRLRDKYGETPLHYAARNGASILVLQSMLSVAPDVVGCNNHKGISPFALLSRSYARAKTREELEYDDQFSSDFEVALLFLCSQVIKPEFTPLVHAAAQTPSCPRSLLLTLMKFFPEHAVQYDHEGKTPLLHAATIHFFQEPDSWDEEMDGYRNQECEDEYVSINEMNQIEEQANFFEPYKRLDEHLTKEPSNNLLLLMLHWNPQAARYADKNGRLPLIHALLHKKTWIDGVQYLVWAAPQVLETRDPVSHLYPFQLAAAENCDLDTIYHLVRSFPQSVASHLKK